MRRTLRVPSLWASNGRIIDALRVVIRLPGNGVSSRREIQGYLDD